MEIRHRHVQTNGIRMHVAECGSGPAVVFLHGFPEFWYAWRHQIKALSGRFHAVAPDLRGYNETERPDSGYDLETLAADVAGLLDALGEKKVHLVGHDWGGALAWYFAHRYPERLHRLAVMNGPHPMRTLEIWGRNPLQVLRSLYILYFQIPWLPEYLISLRDHAGVVQMFRWGAVRKERLTPEDLEAFREAARKAGGVGGGLAYYRAIPSQYKAVRQLRLNPIPVPTLILWTDRDPALSLDFTRGMAKFVSGPLTVRVLHGVGHWIQQEAPDEVNEALLEFFAG
ncbi:MAG: alpha/beta hydrolase [Nitrospirae bacterium]|nr:alpha/beta hydrolase [Nitrospirota bacterium]